MSSPTTLETNGDWLVSWDPEDETKWDKRLAWNTLTVTTVSLTLCFVAWFLPSAIIPKLNALGFTFTKGQLYWMAAMPGLSGGLLRIVWMVLPPKIGTRKMVTLTTLLLLLPVLGWGLLADEQIHRCLRCIMTIFHTRSLRLAFTVSCQCRIDFHHT